MNRTPTVLPRLLQLLRLFSFPKKLGLLDRVFGQWLAQRGTTWVSIREGPTWKLDLTDVCHRWMVYGDYEGSVQMNWIRSWLLGGGNVIDSGANIGEMAVYFAGMKGVATLCVEPVVSSREWLEECISHNGLASLSVANCALGQSAGNATVTLCGSRSTLRSFSAAGVNLLKRTVQVMTLDHLMEQRGISHIRLWKLDVEGWELEALMGARGLLLRRAIDAVLMEVTPGRFAAARDWLLTVGYEPFLISRGGLRPVAHLTEQVNVVVLPIQGSRAV